MSEREIARTKPLGKKKKKSTLLYVEEELTRFLSKKKIQILYSF